MQATAFTGLDVHAGQTHAGILDARTGELHRRRLRGEPVRAVIPFLEGLGPGVRAVYEAGATGFALARAAAEHGLDLQVCAPGLIPKKPSDRVKTDARDAERLARLLAAGELSFVRVPAVAEEQVRDLVRAREDVRCDLNRARQRLSHFLRRRGLGFPGPGKAWTRAHRSWLRSLAFADLASRATFADYLSSVDALGQRRDTLDRVLAEVAPESPWGQMIERLRCFRGIDLLAAVGLCARWATSRASGGRASSRAFWASCRPSAPPTRSVDRGRSPRPVPSTPVACSSRRPSTPGADRRSLKTFAGASSVRTRGSARWLGGPSGASTPSGRSS